MDNQTNVTPDAELVASLEAKLSVVRDRVTSVACGLQTGLYLFGTGGVGKSHTVFETLDLLGKAYKLSNSHLTGKGLCKLLADNPTDIHVIEDAEHLLNDKAAQGVLRSALDEGRQERKITWSTSKAKDNYDFVFEGRLIVVANSPLDDVPALQAIAKRVTVCEYKATDQELAAKMREIASRKYIHSTYTLSTEKCLEVVGVIVDCSKRAGKHLDMRLLGNSFRDRIQYEMGLASTNWVDLVEARIRQRAQVKKELRGSVQAERRGADLDLVRRILTLPAKERLAIWKRETGKGQAMLYRRMTEVEREASTFLLSTDSTEQADVEKMTKEDNISVTLEAVAEEAERTVDETTDPSIIRLSDTLHQVG